MVVFPFCKINIGLWVIGRRSDGYHDIETVFYPVKLTDILEIIISPDKKEHFSASGLDIPGDLEANLCRKAYRLVAADHVIDPVHIHLHKSIPAGAGLGGGSSDGAHAMKVIDRLFGLNLSPQALLGYAARLGSDCAFFLRDKPAFAREKGDKMELLDLDLSRYDIMIVMPPIHIATAEAYSMIVPKERKLPLKEMIARSLPEWKHVVLNDFEEPVVARFPEIGRIRDTLYKAGACYAAMTGSGSAVYGIFPKDMNLEIAFPGCFQWSGSL
jgi:4-diphosphocytidyl-2-C-methyl-D-erythritol kinase